MANHMETLYLRFSLPQVAVSLSTHISPMSFVCPHFTFSLIPASMAADIRTQLLTRHLVFTKTKAASTSHNITSYHLLFYRHHRHLPHCHHPLFSKAMEDVTSHGQHAHDPTPVSHGQCAHPAPHGREEFAAAMLVAARKVEKKDKEETPTEMFVRINEAKVIEGNKSIKSAAKKLVRKKKLKKISTYFDSTSLN
jgi:hypothetical protein